MDEQPPRFHVLSVEAWIRPDHPPRDVKRRVEAIRTSRGARFAAAYRRTGRPSVPPERRLKALAHQGPVPRPQPTPGGRADRQGHWFRWSLDRPPSDEGFDPPPFSRDRDRVGEHRLPQASFDAAGGRAITHGLGRDPFPISGICVLQRAA